MLSQGLEALVDDEDYEYLMQWKWFATKSKSSDYYAVRHEGRKIIAMHRVIMQTPDDLECDHIHHNTLDNRKSQLRNVTRQQNQWNQKLSKNNKTGVKGVCWHTRDKRYRAQIKKDGVRIHIGQYKTIEEAEIAYQEKARELFGEYKFTLSPLPRLEIYPKTTTPADVDTANVTTEAVGELELEAL